MTKLTAKEFTAIWTARNTPAIGKRINSMEMDLKHGPMELDTRDSIMKERNMEMDF